MIRSNDPNSITSNRIYHLNVKGLDLNSGPVDCGTIVGLPAKYIVRRFTVFDASVSLAASAATLGLYSSSGGSGSVLANPVTLTSLTTAAGFVDLGLGTGLTASYRTEPILFIRNTVRHGSAATVSAMLEVVDMTG